MPVPADVVAAGGVASTNGANTNYNFNASVPAQRTGFLNLLQDVSSDCFMCCIQAVLC
jgi:hypothetical protein